MASIQILLLLAIGSSLAQQQDSTRIAGEKGRQVVETVVSLIRESCIFPNDHLLLRRWAYVATEDGERADTYRPGFDGGIWALKQADFQQTKTDPNLQTYYSDIRKSFAIDWTTVQWTDLRKPLYSGLAAELFLVHTFADNVPPAVERQAAWYQQLMSPHQPMLAYNFTKASEQLASACGRSNLDLAFLMDSSSSLSPVDFQNAIDWAAEVLEPFSISATDVRVAFLTFSTGFQVVFDFDDLSSKVAMQNAIRSAQYAPGSTDTDQALNFAATQLFTPTRGARLTSAKVAVLLTDGKASHSSDAIMRAMELRQKGVSIFVIGVGDQVDTTELSSMASAPACTHVQELHNYQDLDTLRAQMQQLSCQAPVVLTNGQNTFQCDSMNNYHIAISGNKTVTIHSSRGRVDIYGSFVIPYPNAAFNEFHTQAVDTKDAIIYVRDESRPLFLSIVSHGSDPSLCPSGNTYTVTVENKNSLRPDATLTCYQNGVLHKCTPLEILSALYVVIIPDKPNFPNPCQPGHPGYYPYPLRTDRFLYCDNLGHMYYVFCPPNSGTTTTRVQTTPKPVLPVRTTVTPQTGSPCTAQAINDGQNFFPYLPDPTKYIFCTGWPGQGVIKNCAPYHKWSQQQQLCIYTDTVVDPTKNLYVTSPRPLQVDCTPGLNDGDLFFHPHPTDPHKFIECDQYGDAFILDCKGGTVWNQKLLTCLPSGLTSDQNLIGR